MFNNEAASTESRRLPVSEHAPVMPLDVRQARFATAMRGYDRQEVTTFLEQTSESYEAALRENERLRQEIARLESSVAQYRELEGSIKNTLMSAQKLADDMRENAGHESTRIVREAEGRAEMILQKALVKLEDVQREIDGLRLRRREAESGIEAMISALGHTLTFVREQDRERQDRQAPRRAEIEAA